MSETFLDQRAVFDRKAFLDRLSGDADMAETIIRAFVEEFPRQVEALRRSVEAFDAEAAARQAHAIKGGAGTVGADALSAVADGIQKAANLGKLRVVSAALIALEREFSRFQEELARTFSTI